LGKIEAKFGKSGEIGANLIGFEQN